MRIGPYSVNIFFIENYRNVTVWLGCEQHGCFIQQNSNLFMKSVIQKNTGPAGPVRITAIY